MPASWDDCRSRRTWGTRTVLEVGLPRSHAVQMGNTLVCFSVEGTLEGFQSVGLEVQVLHHDFGAAQSLGPTTPEFVWSLFSGGNMVLRILVCRMEPLW